MNDASNTLDALRFISDWAKWLITIETGALAVIGAIVNGGRVAHVKSARLWATAAIINFVASIVSAAVLLISLPEIVQNIRPGINIWLTSDSVLGDPCSASIRRRWRSWNRCSSLWGSSASPGCC